MRAARRVGVTTLFILMALLPAVAAIPSDTDRPPDVALSIAQPLSGLTSIGIRTRDITSTPGLLLLVGSALMGLASIVRRTTRS
jgi:hypothetical protein